MENTVRQKNEFAIKLMEVFNEEYLSNQHGCAEVDFALDEEDEQMFNKAGELMFIDCDENVFSASKLFEWYNICMWDGELEDEITNTMRVWHGKAIEAGYITEKTKKRW